VKESHVFNTCNTLRKLTLALPIIGAVLALGAGTAPASAAPAAPPSAAAAAQANIAGQALPAAHPNAIRKVDRRYNDLRTRLVSYAGTLVLSHAVLAKHDKQSHATIVKAGRAGVNAEAKCRRGNGGTRWYRSTIRATRLHADSHYDCDNNGTYNRAIVGLGLFLS